MIKKTEIIRNTAIICTVLASLFSAVAQAAVEEFKLKNGLKIIVQEDHRSPVVVSQIWYRAGSIDEVNGKTGVAHVL